MASMSDIKKGLIIEFKNGLWEVVEFLHVKPGKGAAFTRSKLKNLKTGQLVENTFRGSDKFNVVRVEKSKKQYLYYDGDFYVFMDNTTYEQLSVPSEVIGDLRKFMIENIEVIIRTTGEGEIIGIELPICVVHKVKECEPNVKGNTASASGKKAVTETGLDIIVPFFIEAGEDIKIDTRTGNYMERA